jgi:hypothetical protein
MFKATKKGIVINDTVRVNYGAFAVLALETAVVVRDYKKKGPVGILTGIAKCAAGEVIVNAPAVTMAATGNVDNKFMKGWNKLTKVIGTEFCIDEE